MLKTKRCEGVLSRAGGAVEAKRDHTGVFCCIDDAAATVHSPALRCIRPCWHTCSPGGRTIGIWGFGPMEARGLTGRARPLYSAGFATSPSGRCPISPCGGIGRRARLKIEFRKECWFDSGQGHQSTRRHLRSRINFQTAIPVFTSPRLRGEVASILRAGEGESQAGSDPRIVRLTRRLCFAPSPTSPRKRGEVNQPRLSRHTSTFPQREAPELCRNFRPPKQDEGVGNAGRSMHPQSRVQNG